jgi:hypothetical protein
VKNRRIKPQSKASAATHASLKKDKLPLPPPSKGSSASHSSLSRNCIEFVKIDRPGSVTFIDKFSSFAVCVNVDTSKMQGDQLSDHCQAIKYEVFAAVGAALKNTHHEDTHATTAFLCPQQDESCSTELHVARLSSDGDQWICSENSGVFDTLAPDQTLWLGASGSTVSGESAPAMSVLANRVAAVVPDKWKKVAVQLELSRGEIKAIQKDEDDSFDRFMAVMDHWKQSLSKPFTWATLVSALQSPSVNETRLADELKHEFC